MTCRPTKAQVCRMASRLTPRHLFQPVRGIAADVVKFGRLRPGCCFRRVIEPASRTTNQTKPIAPVTTKASCQPQYEREPRDRKRERRWRRYWSPALKMPVASARSFFGNHSATVLMAAGKFPASPSPSANARPPNADTRGPAHAPSPRGSTGSSDRSNQAASRTGPSGARQAQAQRIGRLERGNNDRVLDSRSTRFPSQGSAPECQAPAGRCS